MFSLCVRLGFAGCSRCRRLFNTAARMVTQGMCARERIQIGSGPPERALRHCIGRACSRRRRRPASPSHYSSHSLTEPRPLSHPHGAILNVASRPGHMRSSFSFRPSLVFDLFCRGAAATPSVHAAAAHTVCTLTSMAATARSDVGSPAVDSRQRRGSAIVDRHSTGAVSMFDSALRVELGSGEPTLPDSRMR